MRSNGEREVNATRPSPILPRAGATRSRASYSGTMAKRPPAEVRALEALADAADAARAARKASKRLAEKPARALRKRAAEAAGWIAAHQDVVERPKDVRRGAERTAADLRRAPHSALREHSARERARAQATPERVRAAMPRVAERLVGKAGGGTGR